ncbi:T9SS C-terminal target domain-containing protein [Sphingobacteriales bacterium UPWRP_1]|nr:hypothetical protein B6N25_08475 [Sphingobacteriales bacterium TSM_CSS]PSJ73019.1 T9SS C-terminal target domain-containing protein [Sphingobacteriales bacterium UPWRP_1]
MKQQPIMLHYTLIRQIHFSIIALFVLLFPCKLTAQNDMCRTNSNYPNVLPAVGISPCSESVTDPFYLRIAVNLIRRSDGSCDRTLADVYEALNLMQEPFAVHDIFFRLECIQFLDDDNLYNQTNEEARYCIDGGTYPNSCIYPNFPGLFFDDAITMFVYPKGTPTSTGGGMGYASGIPGNCFMIKGFYRSVDIDTYGNITFDQFYDGLKTYIIAQEMGHCLGLFHTFHGQCNEDGCEETPLPASDPDNPCECGDYVADTPADPGIGDSIIDHETCELTTLLGCEQVISPNYNPLPNNVMSYAGPTCEYDITKGQKDRIKQHLLNAPLFAPMLQNCIIPLSEINQNLTKNWVKEQTLPATLTEWSSDNIHILGKITVPAGATLYIHHATVEFETETSGIVVQKGGVLIIENHAVLQGNSCNNTPWGGILIEGDAFEPIPTSFYTDGMFFEHHGIARLKNNVVIEGAKAGIQVGDFIDSSLPPANTNNTYGGGALFISQTHFINNSVGVYLLPQFSGNNLFTRFSDCTFTFNATFRNTHKFENIGYTGIYTIRPYLVQGCLFQNTAPVGPAFSLSDRGIGIVSNIYGGWVTPSFTGTPCNFNNLYKGIDAYGLGSIHSGLLVTNNVFDNVTKSITLNGNAVSLISQNQFLRLNKDSYAIYAIDSKGTTIYNNAITVNIWPDAYNEKPLGIAVHNSGIEGAAILKNTFLPHNPTQATVQRFRAAVQVEGNYNANVMIDCNTFTALSDFDIRIFDSPDFKDQGECAPFEPDENPIANLWHNAAAAPLGSYHVYYANPAETFNLTCQAGYEPSVLSSNINLLDCGTDPNTCNSFGFGDYGIIQHMYPQALATLDSIPNTPQGNADFKAIYYAYIQLLTGGSGKNSDAAFVLQQVAIDKTDARQTMAESMYAFLYGNDYIRSVKDNAVYPYNNTNPKKHFILIPNPANEQVTIQFLQPVADQDEALLYDVTGRLISTIAVSSGASAQLNTANLYNGVYYLRLGTSAQVEKLVILH